MTGFVLLQFFYKSIKAAVIFTKIKVLQKILSYGVCSQVEVVRQFFIYLAIKLKLLIIHILEAHGHAIAIELYIFFAVFLCLLIFPFNPSDCALIYYIYLQTQIQYIRLLFRKETNIYHHKQCQTINYRKYLILLFKNNCIFNKSKPIYIFLFDVMQNKQLQECFLQLQKLIKDRTIPPKMELKLKYLKSTLSNDNNSNEQLQKLQQFEKESLKIMNKETQIQLFISIIKCLSGKDTINYFEGEKAMVKKKQMFGSINACKISCDNNKFTICKIKNNKLQNWKQFMIEKMNISELYQKNKNGYGFILSYDNKKYQIKISQEGKCARIHGLLKNAIRIKRSKNQQKQFQFIFEPTYQKQQQQQFQEKAMQQNLIEQQRQYLKSLKNQVQSILLTQSNFSLIKNISNGKIQGNKNGYIKIMIFFEGCSVQALIQSYFRFNAWNVNVDQFRIINKMRNNTYLAYLKFKKNGIFTKQRQAYFTISYLKHCECLLQNSQDKEEDVKKSFLSVQSRVSYKCTSKHYLIINSIDYDQDGSSGCVRADFNQIIEFSQFQDKKMTIFVTLLSKIDFKVYSLLSANNDENVNFLSDIYSIFVYCKQQETYNNKVNIFDINRCVCNIKISNSKIINDQSNKNNGSKHQQMQFDEINLNQQNLKNKSIVINQSKKQILQIIKNGHNHKLNKALIDIIRNKLFEKYYLKLKFDLDVDQTAYVKSNYMFNTNSQFLFQEGRWQIKDNQDLIFVDQKQLGIQKGVIKILAKQITSNILAGKSIMSMSLPVQIFYQFSLLQALSFIFGFLPKYMHNATSTTNIVEQIKNVAIAFMFMWATNPKISKPFNPILGQTYQGMIGGIPVFFEQISHHPPISAFYIKTSKFQAYGNFDLVVDLGLNSANSKVYGPFYVNIFENKTKFVIKFAQLQTSGIMYGDRRNKSIGKGYVVEITSNTYFEYSIGKQKKKLYESNKKMKPNDLIGGIYKVKQQFTSKLLKIDRTKAVEGAKPEDIIQKLSHATGRWYGDIYFDNVEYKSINGTYPVLPIRQSVVLPSDCLFREDIYYKQMEDNKTSNEEKQVLQNLQRKDRKLRQKYNKKH